MDPSQSFQNAASYLSSSPSLSKVSSAAKLELYGLFKYITSSKMPSTDRPSIFDLTGRAKWDAWAATGKQYQDPAEAEKRYLEIAQTLGWTRSTTETQVQNVPSSSASEGAWDDDDDNDTPEASNSGGGGLGWSVSVMMPPPSTIDKSIHGLALSNDVLGLTTLLEQRPETELDALDEFGYTPLHLACDRGNIDIVRLLLKKGADHSLKDSDNLSPIELAKEAGQSEIEAILSSIH
ncbi:ankyrin [Phlegmacium glaucopus]|nr:ankyrin [Phlegmacium glaucopus]